MSARLLQTLAMGFPTPNDPRRAPVWENYVIEIDLEYQSYDGEKEEDWSIDVGDWTSEYHLKVGGFTFF